MEGEHVFKIEKPKPEIKLHHEDGTIDCLKVDQSGEIYVNDIPVTDVDGCKNALHILIRALTGAV